MRTSARVAISMPKQTLALLDRAKRKAKRSRSALVSEAVERYLQDTAPGDREKQYAEAYARIPEVNNDKTARAVLETWDDWQ